MTAEFWAICSVGAIMLIGFLDVSRQLYKIGRSLERIHSPD